MNSPEGPKKVECFIPLKGYDCPKQCMGRLALQWADDNPYHPEGIMVQVCRNPDKAGNYPSAADYCGNGADVLTFYQMTPATDEQIKGEVENWSW